MAKNQQPSKAKETAENKSGDGKFRWDAENDRKLLLLTFGRTLNGKLYDEFVKAFPGTTRNGLVIRISKLRIAAREICDQIGLPPAETQAAATSTSTKANDAPKPASNKASRSKKANEPTESANAADEETPEIPAIGKGKKRQATTPKRGAEKMESDEDVKDLVVKEEVVPVVEKPKRKSGRAKKPKVVVKKEEVGEEEKDGAEAGEQDVIGDNDEGDLFGEGENKRRKTSTPPEDI